MITKALKTVAIIGRPNVGKSTLFNRLVGKRVAIETEIAGTTRDRLYGRATWGKTEFEIVDVAGIEKGTKSEISTSIQAGVEIAIESADLIVFVTDWFEPDNESDKKIARMLRKINKPAILIVNKADNIERISDLKTFDRLGITDLFPVSAISGKGTGDLLDCIVKKLKKIPKKTEKTLSDKKYDIKLSIVGRPNVGKSTLLNNIIGEKRAVVSSEAGTTRDTVDVNFFHKGLNIQIKDTAGLRRPGKIEKDTIESFSALRTERALKESDIAVLLIDGQEGLVNLEANILGIGKESGKGLVLAVNKIDLMGDKKEVFIARTIHYLQTELNFVPWLPVVFISADSGENINILLNQVVAVYENRKTEIPQDKLNEILETAKAGNTQLENFVSMKQETKNPPAFEIKLSGHKKPHPTVMRYLENKLRDTYPLNGTPIFLDLN